MTLPLRARSTRSRAVAALALTTVAALALTSCSAPAAGGESSAGSSQAEFRLGISETGGDVDPLTVADSDAQLVTGLVTEQLLSFDSAGSAKPRLAIEWSASEDGLTWTVVLREGATFNDGAPVTAADVVATFESITGEDSLSPAKSAFAGILEGVEAIDDGTVRFTLARPFSDFPRLLAGSNTGILPADYEPGTWLENPVGAGQFVLEEYTVGVGATYAKNPDYWNADEIGVDGVELKVYADDQARLLAFQAGEIDRINVSPDVAATVDAGDYDEIESGYTMFYGIHLNVTEAPFDDPTVREALAWAIDRQGIVDLVHDGNADVGDDYPFYPDHDAAPTGIEQREQDLEKVAELLDGRTVSFEITTAEQLYGEVLQQQLSAVPGFEVTLDVLTSEEYYAEGDDSPWLNAPLTVTTWGKRTPSQYLGLFYAGGAAWNASHYDNPQLEQLGAEFDATTDPAERQDLANRIALIQWTDVPTIIPALARTKVLQNTRVGDFAGPLDFWSGYDLAGIALGGQ